MQIDSKTAATAERVSGVIFDYAARIAREQDTEKLLALVADMARDLVGADRCGIWLIDKVTGEAYSVILHGSEGVRLSTDEGLAELCLRTGESFLVNHAQSDPRVIRKSILSSDYAVESLLLVPLRGLDTAIIGAFHATNKPGGFVQSDIDLLQLTASFSANAIETQRLRIENEAAQLLYKELEVARSVQERLLPRGRPETAGLDYAAACVPARFIGGDYFDFLLLPGEQFAFTIGDVSGKGIAAAVLMASIQASLRTLLLKNSSQLPTLMADFNKFVCSTSSMNRYSTLFCGVLDLRNLQLTYVNAGHCDPILRRGDETPTLERLNVGGTPIGLLPLAHYEQATVQLRSGDHLFCYTDGISEVQNRGDELWDERELDQVIDACGDLSARDALERVFAAANAFRDGAEPTDDATGVVLRIQ